MKRLVVRTQASLILLTSMQDAQSTRLTVTTTLLAGMTLILWILSSNTSTPERIHKLKSTTGAFHQIDERFLVHCTEFIDPSTSYCRDFAAAQHNQQRFFLTPYRLDSKASKVFQELEGEGREELRENVEKIINQLEEDGKTLGTALLDSHAIRILTEAQAFINHCIHRYLHKTVIDDRLLPLTNLNDPPPSVFLGFPNAVALQLITLDKKYHVR